jgi:hypothetical protein
MRDSGILYHRRQPGHVIVGTCLTVVAVFTVVLPPPHGPAVWVMVGVVALVFLMAYLFRSMTVEVTEHEVRFFFGSGFWRRSIRIEEVAASRAVTNSPLWGWGIRYTPRGWLYNVSGLRAVEITRRDGSRLLVGSDEPERLHAAIESARVGLLARAPLAH